MRRRDRLGASLMVLAATLDSPAAQAREQEAATAAAPAGAIVLFDGTSLEGWVSRKGGPARWTVRDGYAEVVPGAGDIRTRETFGDFQLHVEFRVPLMPAATGQRRGNSGVFLQGRYEIQVLDSWGLLSGKRDCAAIYRISAPLRNACRPPEVWQSYDVRFRAARGKQKARVTVLHNGILVHDDLELPHPTHRALDGDVTRPGPILLQDHGTLVRYRNLWILRAE